MKNTKIPLLVFALVAILAVICLVLVFKVQKQSAVTYQQLIHRDYAVHVDYDVCSDVPCEGAEHIADVYVGDAVQSVNAVCQCNDGRTFQKGYRRNY